MTTRAEELARELFNAPDGNTQPRLLQGAIQHAAALIERYGQEVREAAASVLDNPEGVSANYMISRIREMPLP